MGEPRMMMCSLDCSARLQPGELVDEPKRLLSVALPPNPSRKPAQDLALVPGVVLVSEPPEFDDCRVLTALDASGNARKAASDTARALDAHWAEVARMIGDGPTASRSAALTVLRELADQPAATAVCRTMAAPPHALVDALAAAVRLRAEPREPADTAVDTTRLQFLRTADGKMWADTLHGLKVMPAAAGVLPPDDALATVNALCATHALYILAKFLYVGAPNAATDAAAHALAGRLLDTPGFGDDVLSWACSDMYARAEAAPAQLRDAARRMPEGRFARFRGPPLPPGAAVLGLEPFAGRSRTIALQLASRLIYHGVLYDAASAKLPGRAAFARAAVRLAAASLAGPAQRASASVPGIMSAKRVRAAAAQLLHKALLHRFRQEAATLNAVAPAQQRLRREALEAGALPRCAALMLDADLSVPSRGQAGAAGVEAVTAAATAAEAAPFMRVVASQLFATAERLRAAGASWAPTDDEDLVVASLLAMLKKLCVYAELRADPTGPFSEEARPALRALRACFEAAPSWALLLLLSREILELLAAAPQETLAANAQLAAAMAAVHAAEAAAAEERAVTTKAAFDAASERFEAIRAKADAAREELAAAEAALDAAKERAAAATCSHCKRKAPDGGRLKVCATCRSVRYCGSECQLAAWPQHKAACKALKRAAMAADS